MIKNYKEVKNFMHNELGITREDIQSIIKEAVNVEVKKIIDGKRPYIEQMVDEYTKEYIEHTIKNGLTDGGRLVLGFKERVSSTLSNAIGNYVASQLDIQIGVKNTNNENILEKME